VAGATVDAAPPGSLRGFESPFLRFSSLQSRFPGIILSIYWYILLQFRK
jgi:hypothetical protein